MKKNYLNYVLAICILAVVGLFFSINPTVDQTQNIGDASNQKELWSTKKSKVKSGQDAYMKPDGFIEYFNSVSKRIDQSTSEYVSGYRFNEISKAAKITAQARVEALDVEFISRGPGNVGGRTRAIAIDPADDTHCTWIAGAASGGLWKTTDCGLSWTNISEGLPNLSTNSIAQAASNPDIIYVGTGEVFAGNSTFVRGDGIYKSTDRGTSWELLPSTVDNTDYISVNRIAVDPSDENIVVIATNTGIYKSTDGGASWAETFDAPVGASVQDLQVDPTDYNIQYAGVNSNGIAKSTDAGNTWTISSDGIAEGVRFEIAVSPSNPDIIYTSTFSGPNTLLYFSDDKGENWVLADDPDYDTNFLGAQGWYDNTIAVNPYNPYEVFVGGVSIGKYVIDPENIGESDRQYLGSDFENTDFLSFVNFGADFEGGTINIATGSLSPSQNPMTVEIRFGEDNTQKAHRFTVPSTGGSNGDGGAGIPESDYTYQDYIDVPFEVWDIENNRQLMVSFRDQEDNGVFDLNPRDDASDPNLLKAREYLYIHDIDYDAAAPNAEVTDQTGGIAYANMYYFWPILTTGATWDPATFSNAIMRLNYGSQFVAAATAVAVYDAYGNWEGQNSNTLHPDHHHLTFIKTDEANEQFMVINGNDGAFGFSTDNGITFEEREEGYVTSQFYGADKKPGEDKYIGGMQDNGTYVSTGTTVDATNQYSFEIGGDGFEVIWHATDTDLVIGGSQFNGLRRSTNGGQSFSNATTGMVDDGPFITRLAGSNTSPDVIYALGAAGVYKSNDFGASWNMKEITAATWSGDSQASDVEVSLANDQIVWAGAGMAEGVLDIFVSTDAGETYEPVSIASINPNASTTGIYTHPTDENTAYVLFSVAGQAKILKTEDLGQTWTDISGFDGSETSSNGFPDVFTHSLLVMPFNTDIIWVGTEIGLFESLDGGTSWNFRNDFPSVSIWSMKIVDDQVVMGTHGRGIWTATIEELALSSLKVEAFSYLGYGNAEVNVDLPVEYDLVKVYVNDVEVGTLDAPTVGSNTVAISDFFEFKGAEVKIVGNIASVDYESRKFDTEEIDVAPQIFSFESAIDGDVYPVSIEVENNEPFDKVEVLFNDEVVYTDEQILTEGDAARVINFDYDQQGINRLQIRAHIQGEIYITDADSNIITSSSERLNSSIKVYPNPTASYVNISSNGIVVDEVKIYSSNGVQVNKIDVSSNSKNTQIDLTSLNRGVYLIQIVGQDGRIISKRIIKE